MTLFLCLSFACEEADNSSSTTDTTRVLGIIHDDENTKRSSETAHVSAAVFVADIPAREPTGICRSQQGMDIVLSERQVQ